MGDNLPPIDCYCQQQLISPCIPVLAHANKNRRALSPRRQASTQREGAMAIGRQNYLSGKYSVRHMCAFVPRTCWPHKIHQHSSPQPYSHHSLLPGNGSTSLRRAEHSCPGLRAPWEAENCMEHCVNGKSSCHKQQLQSFKSGLSFMRQRRREGTS